jgi:hypothetical protein
MPTTRTPRRVLPAPAAPASRATLLKIDPTLFLNHLFQFTAARLIVRGRGISLFRRTQFGVFHPLESPDGNSRHDPVSGLTLDPALVRRIYYLSGGDSRGAFELEFAGIGFSLGLIPERDPANDEVVATLLSAFGAGPVAPGRIFAKGASDWLDEGFSSHGEQWANAIAFDRESREVDINIHSPTLAIRCRMQPVFADRDRSIIRLSDAEANTVLHFDSRSTTCSTLTLPFFRS